MKTKTAFLILLCFFTFNLFSQDTIVKHDRTIIISKVLEISPKEISYSIYNSTDGSSFTLSKSEISSITYSNGTKELFNTAEEKIITKKQEEPSFTEPTEKEKPAPSRIEIRNSKKHRLTISTSLYPLFIYEEIINIDYCYRYRHSFGFSLGQVYPNSKLEVNILASDQTVDPGLIYNGYSARLNYKCFITNNRRLSLSTQLLYKTLSYRNHLFMNMNDGTNYYVLRSEDAKVFGIDLLQSFQITKPQSLLNLEVFTTIGYRYWVRDYTTFETYVEHIGRTFNDPEHPLGTYQLKQYKIWLSIGLKLGINTFFK